MKFPLTEPYNPRYLSINPESNTVHILMPVVGGNRVSTDNTCKSVASLTEFFDLSAAVGKRSIVDELNSYAMALQFDLSLLDEDSELYQQKNARLSQIRRYQSMVSSVLTSGELACLNRSFPEYPQALKTLMTQEKSNLYSMLLKPEEEDSFLRFVNTVFSVKRGNEAILQPLLKQVFDGVEPIPGGNRAKLIQSVVEQLKGGDNSLESIQAALSEQSKALFDINVDFYRNKQGEQMNKQYIDETMGFDGQETAEEYMNALLGYCAPDLFDNLIESPFYARKNAEELSRMTQFFLGSVTIYCRAQQISDKNFGEVLESDETLREDIVALIISIDNGKSIENALLDYMNTQQQAFGLKHKITPADKKSIIERFQQDYTLIKDSAHFDEFAILDSEKAGSFVTHQGSICVNFAAFIKASNPALKPSSINAILDDFEHVRSEVTPINKLVCESIEMDVEQLLAKIHSEEQLDIVLKKLPEKERQEILASPQIKKLQVPKFLHCVARGQRKEAEQLLKDNPDANFLLSEAEFTDNSGRTFNCTAYEYAYWATDTHMRRMLEKHMDDETKAEMLQRIEAIDKHGLTYYQHGKEIKGEKHFDFSKLTQALQAYVDGYDDWSKNNNRDAMENAWIKGVGMAQRELPVHAMNEYLRKDRSFYPCPEFNEDDLPYELSFYNCVTHEDEEIYPIAPLDSVGGLGLSFGLYRGSGRLVVRRGCVGQRRQMRFGAVAIDLAAIIRLDEVRTNELTLSHDFLKDVGSSLGLVM